MKRILILVLCLVNFLVVSAQGYKKQWEDVEQAVQNDLPKTAIHLLQQIKGQAQIQSNKVQELKAYIRLYYQYEKIARDSASQCLAEMERRLTAENDAVMRALWHQAMMKIYNTSRSDTASVSAARRHMVASLQIFDELGEIALSPYQDFFQKGKGDTYFHEDLLSPLAREVLQQPRGLSQEERTQLYARLIGYYRNKGNREATLLWTLDSIQSAPFSYDPLPQNPKFVALCRVADEFRDLSLNAQTYLQFLNFSNLSPSAQRDSILMCKAEEGVHLYRRSAEAKMLKSYLKKMQLAEVAIQEVPQVAFPGETIKLTIEGKNLEEAELRLYRLDLTASAYEYVRKDAMKWKKFREGKATVLPIKTIQMPPYKCLHDTLETTFASPGLYECALYVNGKWKKSNVVHVSSVRPIWMNIAADTVRAILLDAESGRVNFGGEIVIFDKDGKKKKSLYPDEDGHFYLTEELQGAVCFPRVGADEYMLPFVPSRKYYNTFAYSNTRSETTPQLFADLAIYRPGQTVRLAGVVFTKRGDEFHTESQFPITLRLYDTNHKEIQKWNCITDELGNFSENFTLPKVCLTGDFTAVAQGKGGQRTSLHFKVEEYKRPTFTISVAEPEKGYALGDTVTLVGKARSYVDLPIAGAKVKWNLERTTWYPTAEQLYSANGEAVTDENGQFLIPAYLCGGTDGKDFARYQRYFYTINYDVTADNGETASGSIVLQAGTRSYWLDSTWPNSICRETRPRLVVDCFNAAGKAQKHDIDYTLWQYTTDNTLMAKDSVQVACGKLVSGESVDADMLKDVASGKYAWQFTLMDNDTVVETLRRDFILYSETDNKLADSSVFWHHIRYNQQRDSAYVMIGSSSEDITLFCDKFAEGKLLESQRVEFSDSIVKFQLAYDPSYGESARWCFALMKNGKMYTAEADILKPEPEKKLLLEWETFRSYLTPGQTEEWILSVRNPDGTPAAASVMARMYDASLDAFLRQDWRFSRIVFPRQLNIRFWEWNQYYNPTLYYCDDFRHEYTYWPLSFATWNASLFFNQMPYGSKPGIYKTSIKRANKTSTPVVNVSAMNESMVMRDMVELSVSSPIEETAATSVDEGNMAPRTNFAETAFFHPNLKTDDKGCVKISFTLPESLTSWRFNALAHTEHMDYGSLDTLVVARKDFMVQPSLPRFVRAGDKFAIPITLRNLSSQSLSPKIVLTIVDEATGKQMFVQEKCHFIETNGVETLMFWCKVPEDMAPTSWICRVTAQSERFKDGEEHYLPVLSNCVEVVRSVPFSMRELGTRTIQLDDILQAENSCQHTLTVDITSHPTWTAVQTLPVLTDRKCYGAKDWAAQYYALQMSQYIAQTSPEIKDVIHTNKLNGEELPNRITDGLDSSTPWLSYAERELKRGEEIARLFDESTWAVKMATATEQLLMHQNADGSWSWFKGMQGNYSITLDIAILLAKMEAAIHNPKSKLMLTSAMKYIDEEIAKQVKYLRSNRGKSKSIPFLSSSQIDYLYLYATNGCELNDDGQYLLNLAQEQLEKYLIQNKPRLAVVMAKFGKDAEAKALLESLNEYMVESSEMGKYFDGKLVQGLSASQQILMQTSTIEALLQKDVEFSDEIEAMRLWLMQSLRTQLWQDSPGTADALHALLLSNHYSHDNVKGLGQKSTLYYTLYAGKNIIDAPSDKAYTKTVGNFTKVYDATNSALFTAQGAPKKDIVLNLRQTEPGVAWGSATARFVQPLLSVQKASSGFDLGATCEVLHHGKWIPVNAQTQLAVGDRIRIVMTIRTDRTYDFVRLVMQHPSGVVPTRSLSGYTHSGDLWAYRAVTDTETLHFIEEIKKGEAVYIEEYIVNRAGYFQFGTMQIQCMMAPEFSGVLPMPCKVLSVE